MYLSTIPLFIRVKSQDSTTKTKQLSTSTAYVLSKSTWKSVHSSFSCRFSARRIKNAAWATPRRHRGSGRLWCPSMIRIKISAGVQCGWGLFITYIRSTASVLICKRRCEVEMVIHVRKIICSRISICHLFWTLTFCPTVRITSPLLKIAFYSQVGDSDSTMLHLMMHLTEHIQQFDDIVHTSSLCTTDPGDSRRFAHLLDKLHALVISYARRHLVRSTLWNLDVSYTLSIRLTVWWSRTLIVFLSFLLLIRSEFALRLVSHCVNGELSTSNHVTSYAGGPVSLHFTSVSRTWDSSVLNVDYLLLRWYDRRDDRTFTESEHDSDQNNCRCLVLLRSFHYSDP